MKRTAYIVLIAVALLVLAALGWLISLAAKARAGRPARPAVATV